MTNGHVSGSPEPASRFPRMIDLNHFQVATAKTARDINRRIVLNLIRKFQPVSRADLSRHSRLQRSTVSAITEQLIAERWVTMGALGSLPRGRKPTFLHLNGDRAGILGVDVRPLETTIAVADLSMRFLMQDSMPTGSDSERFIAELCKRLCRMIDLHSHITFEGIGLALPGRIDLASGRLIFAPNLGWTDVDLKTPLEKATGLPVELENAANACALAETWSNRHSKDVRNLVAVTVSEGLGVGMIFNGQLVRGSSGIAGEFGHVPMEKDGPVCSCGNRGCLEASASNQAAIRYFVEMETKRTGRKPSGAFTFDAILTLSEEGNPSARKALIRMAQNLGMGLAMLATGLAPDVILVIGEVTRAWDLVGPVIEDMVQQRSPTRLKTRIVPTDPNCQPRLGGTIALVLQEHFGAPHIV